MRVDLDELERLEREASSQDSVRGYTSWVGDARQAFNRAAIFACPSLIAELREARAFAAGAFCSEVEAHVGAFAGPDCGECYGCRSRAAIEAAKGE